MAPKESQLVSTECRDGARFVRGKVEFCLPTKLHAPSLANRSIGRKDYAFNAFGLFAPEAQATLGAKRSDLGAYDSRFGEPEHHITVRLAEVHLAQVEADSANNLLLSGNRKSTEEALCETGAPKEGQQANQAARAPVAPPRPKRNICIDSKELRMASRSPATPHYPGPLMRVRVGRFSCVSLLF
ncbi:MAG: hypothetical protein OEN21_04370 [Myxococcales bacterium]|nr:hypothetical protein [Myxococcales bacterium]